MPRDCYRVYVYQVWTLVLIAQSIFLLERGQTDIQTNKQTRLNAIPMHAGVYDGVGKINMLYIMQCNDASELSVGRLAVTGHLVELIQGMKCHPSVTAA